MKAKAAVRFISEEFSFEESINKTKKIAQIRTMNLISNL